LLRLLAGHGEVEVTYLTAHAYVGKRVGDLYPGLRPYSSLGFAEFSIEEARQAADFFFVALPHGEAMKAVPPLLEGGCKVCDLSADYRLKDRETYEQWYKVEHTSSHLLAEAVYGLPEINRRDIARADLVAVPGCYPTAAILALAPAMKRASGATLVIDAKSGLSGAGRSLSLATHFAQADENVSPYNVGSHRHAPEIEQVLSQVKGEEAKLVFTPHLVPMSRGILATCYLELQPGQSPDQVASLYESAYQSEEFVVLLPEGEFPQTKAVMGSNYCHIGWLFDGTQNLLIVASAIDNLAKGASGQAIQCMNIMNGWPEAEGLRGLGISP
jgi:N-acetyl-gamma-glutamyl-phosphate reductase